MCDAPRAILTRLFIGIAMSPIFTPRCECILETAVATARTLGHEYVGPEHILCASLIDLETRVQGCVLHLEITATSIQHALREAWPPSERHVEGIPFCPQACNCIANAIRGCFGIRGFRVGSQHLVECVLSDIILRLSLAKRDAFLLPASGISAESLQAFLLHVPLLFPESD